MKQDISYKGTVDGKFVIEQRIDEETAIKEIYVGQLRAIDQIKKQKQMMMDSFPKIDLRIQSAEDNLKEVMDALTPEQIELGNKMFEEEKAKQEQAETLEKPISQ